MNKKTIKIKRGKEICSCNKEEKNTKRKKRKQKERKNENK